MHHPLLSTPRLTIRPFVLEDALQVYRLNASLAVMQHLPKDEVYETVDQARVFLERYLGLMKEVPFAREAVIRKSDGAWLGWCGLKALEGGEVDLGFRFHRAYWGKGYATESGKAWLDYGFGEANLKRIIGNAASENIGSQRALEKLGFQRCPGEDFSEDGFDWMRYELRS
ncbi:MAG: GNAT family N-acetyltransferase [Lewinella sp.]